LIDDETRAGEMAAGVSLQDLLITSRAAGLVGVSVATFTAMCNNGRIAAALRVGPLESLPPEDVEALHRKLHPRRARAIGRVEACFRQLPEYR
jgi:hypothetical protein